MCVWYDDGTNQGRIGALILRPFGLDFGILIQERNRFGFHHGSTHHEDKEDHAAALISIGWPEQSRTITRFVKCPIPIPGFHSLAHARIATSFDSQYVHLRSRLHGPVLFRPQQRFLPLIIAHHSCEQMNKVLRPWPYQESLMMFRLSRCHFGRSVPMY